MEIALTAAVGMVVAWTAFGRGRLRENLAIMGQYRARHILAGLLTGAQIKRRTAIIENAPRY